MKEFRKIYEADNEISELLRISQNRKLNAAEIKNILGREKSDVVIENGLVKLVNSETGKSRIYIPRSCVKYVLNKIHDSEHSGIQATKKIIQKYFKITGLNSIVSIYVKSCLTCQFSRANEFAKKFSHNLLPPPPNFAPSSSLFMDVFHPFGQQRTKGIITVCANTNYVVITPIQNETARLVSKKFMSEILPIFWGVSEIHCDSGPCFRSEVFKSSLLKLGIKIIFTPPYRPNSNLAETNINHVKKYFRLNQITEKEFLDYHRLISVVLNLRQNSKIGSRSPYELFHLKSATKTREIEDVLRNRWPETTFENFSNMTLRLEEREKLHKDKKNQTNELVIGERVIIYQPSIESVSFRVPFSETIYIVQQIRGPMVYLKEENSNQERIRHYQHCVRLVERPDFLK